MPNPPQGLSQPPVQFLVTSNLHLATLLATVGAKPLNKIIDGGKNERGDQIVKWTFQSDAVADEAMSMWQDPGNFRKDRSLVPCRDWNAMTHEEKAMAVNLLSAFTCNLKHFLKEIKTK